MVNEYPDDMKIYLTPQDLKAAVTEQHGQIVVTHLLGNHHTIYYCRDGAKIVVEWLVEGQARFNPTAKVFLPKAGAWVDVPYDYAEEAEEQEGGEYWDLFETVEELLEDVAVYNEHERIHARKLVNEKTGGAV